MKYNHMKKSIMAAVLLAGAVFTAKSSSVTFDLDTQFNGTQIPGPTVPWLTATITDAQPNTVLLSLTASSLYPGAFVSEWDFNFDPNQALNALTFASTNGGSGTVGFPTVSLGTNSFVLDGTGGYADIKLSFANGDFTSGETIVLAITGIPGLNASMFNFASVNSTTGPWYSAAMVGGIPCPGCGGTTIAWIGDCTSTTTNTPEPATMAILGSFIAFGVYLKRRNGQSAKA